jgi:release factor glutamine methyltransferase
MYTPAEDSLMLENHVEKLSKGKVLDMGTGIGIQAIAASKNNAVKEVLAADVDKETVEYCKRNVKNRKITFIKSDLFSDVKGKFDTIVFNPPYLPEEKDIKIKDKALYGGEQGIELIERFFSEANSHLNENGTILMVFSSITGKKKVDAIIKKAGFKFKELEKQHIFFEDLFVYIVKR